MAEKREGTLILFPDFEQLKTEIEQLRTELSMLVLEKDELRYVQAKNLEMQYMLELGAIEYQVYEAQCAMLRLKRKIELIQAKKNREEKLVLADIEDILDAEFAAYQDALNAKIEEMNEAIKRSNGELLSDADAKELKHLYHKIVKALHPDLHPELTDAQLTLFHNAVLAYENGDLKTMQIISAMVSGAEEIQNEETAILQLTHEKERLLTLLSRLKEDIAEIKSNYPFTVKELLQHPEKIRERKEELQEILRQYKEIISTYRARIEKMVG